MLDRRNMLDRRKLLTLGSAAGAALLLPTAEAMARVGARRPRRLADGAAPALDPFSVRMPLPPVLTPVAARGDADVYDVAVQPANAEIFPGIRTPVLTYGGHFVGPTIKAKTGRPVLIRYRNATDGGVNVHLHGGHVPASSDGYPTDVIQPGGSKVYQYPNRQRGATLWYHDHAHHMEAEHVFRGLSGFYLLEDDAEEHLGLPSGRYDVPVLLRDARFDENGAIVFSAEDDSSARPVLLANGRPQPYFPVAARKYRFRILNGANHREYNLDLGGVEMIQIASDGGLLPHPVPRTELFLAPAERAEVVIDFGRHPIGTKLVLADETGPVLRFDVTRSAHDDSQVPDDLRPLPPLPPATVVRDIKLGLSDALDMFWINGKPFDPDHVDTWIKRGTTEIWRVTNLDAEYNIPHNFHVHLVQFRVLDRDGAAPGLGENGLKDTVMVPPGSTVRIQATFGNYLGRYVYHCHMMEHASAFGMMAQLEIVE